LHSLFAQPKSRLVGAAGRLSPEKGFDKLIESAALLVKDHADVGLVIFGQGPLQDDLGRQIHERGLTNHVVLAGFRNNLEDYLPHFDLVALSSYTEGLPVIVLEALAARVPVVATSVGGVPEVIEEGISGYLVPAGDAVALATQISHALDNDSARKAMGQRGRECVESKFTFAAQSQQYQRLFEQLLPQRSRVRPTHQRESLGSLACVSG
jgi:glycosyltransferase involved in cell wall biosynthesis